MHTETQVASQSEQEQIEAIGSEVVRQHAADILSRLAVTESLGHEGSVVGSHEQHDQAPLGTSPTTERIRTEIAHDVRSVHDILAATSQSGEVGSNELWIGVLQRQRQVILEARQHGETDAVKPAIMTHLATIELSADVIGRSDDLFDVPTANGNIVRRSQGLEPVLHQGMARDVVEAARDSYGLVVVRPNQSRVPTMGPPRWEYASVAHVAEACATDIELGLKQELSLDPAEAGLRDMSDEVWDERVKAMGLREAASAAAITAAEASIPVETAEQRIVTLTGQSFKTLDTSGSDEPRDRDGALGQADAQSLVILAEANPSLLTSPAYDEMFTRLRIGRQIHSNYRQNNSALQRQDQALISLVDAGERELAGRMLTSSSGELGGEGTDKGPLGWAIDFNGAIDKQATREAIDAMVNYKLAAVQERTSELAGTLVGGTDELGRAIAGSQLATVIQRAHDPETALEVAGDLLPTLVADGDPQSLRSELSSWNMETGSNSEIFFNALERGRGAGMSTGELLRIVELSHEVRMNAVPYSTEAMARLGHNLEHPIVHELAQDADKRKEIYAVLAASDIELADSFDGIFANPLTSNVYDRAGDKSRLAYDMIAHNSAWAELAVPAGMNQRMAEKVLGQRLDLLHPTSGQHLEQVSTAIGILQGFELPEELTGPLARLQADLVVSIVQFDSIDKLPSPAKAARLLELMPDDNLRALYAELYDRKQADPSATAQSLLAALRTEHNAAGTYPGLDSLRLDEPVGPGHHILKQLRPLSLEYKQWNNDRQKWLNEYANQPIVTSTLTLAWQTRYQALQHGAADSPSAINAWGRENALQVYVNKLRNEQEDFGTDTFANGEPVPSQARLDEHQALVSELCRVYPPEQALSAIQRYLKLEATGLPTADIKAARADIAINDNTYTVEILAKDDPRGMTIGVDTGCCMTLGGASKNCIWAGYEDSRYGFFVVTANDRVRAQSLVYHNQDEAGNDVVVFDNIEANAGTDFTVMQQVYSNAFRQFAEQGVFGSSVSAAHIGVGYTQQEILAGLQDVQAPVPTPLEGTYTDAASQKVLVNLRQ